MNAQTPDPDDDSDARRIRAEDDAIRAAVLQLVASAQSSDRLSGWLLAAGGGLIALQLGVSANGAAHAPRAMLIATFITIGSLFLGVVARLMTYGAGRISNLWGGRYPNQIAEIRDRYLREMTELAKYRQSVGMLAPVLRDLDLERINRQVTILTDAKQRMWGAWPFAAVDRLAGLLCGSDACLNTVGEEWRTVAAAARLSTAAQVWVAAQLLLLILGAAVSAAAFSVKAVAIQAQPAVASSTSPPGPVPSTVPIPHSAYTGEIYRGLDDASRGFYIAGVMDGLLGAPLLGANARVAEGLHECLLQFPPAQTVAIIDQYIADHPADLQLDMHILAVQALRPVCPSFETEFRRTFQLHP